MREFMMWITAFLVALVVIFGLGYALVAFIGLYLPTLDVTQWNGFQRGGFLVLLFVCGVIATSYTETTYEMERLRDEATKSQ